jgi:hypothetical protein
MPATARINPPALFLPAEPAAAPLAGTTLGTVPAVAVAVEVGRREAGTVREPVGLTIEVGRAPEEAAVPTAPEG